MKSNNVPWTWHTTACVAGCFILIGVWFYGFIMIVAQFYDWAQ